MKQLIITLSITLIFFNSNFVLGQNDLDEYPAFLIELEKEGGAFKQIDYETSFVVLSDKLSSVAAKCINVERNKVGRQDLYENKTHFVWNATDSEANQMYVIVTNKEFKQVSCVKKTFREVYLIEKALQKF